MSKICEDCETEEATIKDEYYYNGENYKIFYCKECYIFNTSEQANDEYINTQMELDIKGV